jgi:hypothetical protein
MTSFNTAYANITATTRKAQRLFALEYRWNMRFRLWEHPDDPGIEARARGLAERQHVARNAAEAAEWDFEVLWDRLAPIAADRDPDRCRRLHQRHQSRRCC